MEWLCVIRSLAHTLPAALALVRWMRDAQVYERGWLQTLACTSPKDATQARYEVRRLHVALELPFSVHTPTLE